MTNNTWQEWRDDSALAMLEASFCAWLIGSRTPGLHQQAVAPENPIHCNPAKEKEPTDGWFFFFGRSSRP